MTEQFFLPALRIDRVLGISPQELIHRDSNGAQQDFFDTDSKYAFAEKSAAIIPPSFPSPHQIDVERILYNCHDELVRILDPTESPGHLARTKELLVEIESRSGQLADLLREFSRHARPEVYEQFDQVKILATDSVPYLNIAGPIEEHLDRLAFAARIASKYSALNVVRHRPREGLLLSVADAAAMAWTCLGVVAGKSLRESFPTGRNFGLRWCTEVLIGVTTAGWSGEVRLPKNGWSVRTIEDAIRVVSKELAEWLQGEDAVEPQSEWGNKYWDSVGGFHVILHGASIMDPAELLISHPYAEIFFRDMEDKKFGYFLSTNDGPVPLKIRSK